MAKRKNLLGLAFAGLAALSLIAGYTRQEKSQAPPKSQAYTYSSENNGTVKGRVGSLSCGLEYLVSDLPKPKASVVVKPDNTITARMDYDSGEKKAGFYAEKKIGEKSSLKGSACFEGKSQDTNASYHAAFDSWLENMAFSYTERVGRKQQSFLNADFGLNLLGRRFGISLSYDLLGKRLGLKNFRYV